MQDSAARYFRVQGRTRERERERDRNEAWDFEIWLVMNWIGPARKAEPNGTSMTMTGWHTKRMKQWQRKSSRPPSLPPLQSVVLPRPRLRRRRWQHEIHHPFRAGVAAGGADGGKPQQPAGRTNKPFLPFGFGFGPAGRVERRKVYLDKLLALTFRHFLLALLSTMKR